MRWASTISGELCCQATALVFIIIIIYYSLSGEREALHCLLAKVDECYNFMEVFLNSTGLTAEEAEIIDFHSLWQEEMLNLICEMSGGILPFFTTFLV